MRLLCVERGAGAPAVVFLHGLAGYVGEWQSSMACLASTHRALAFDQRGHGGSSRVPGEVSRGAYIADVVAVIERFAAAPVVLVGQSLGGHTALLTAAARPDLVAALVVAEASPARDPEGPARLRRWLASWPTPFPSRAAAASYFQSLGYFHTRAAARVWAEGLEQGENGHWPRFETELMVESLTEVATTDYWDRWQAIHCPTLVVRGEHGALSRPEAERMLTRLPGSQLAEIRGAGHDLHLDQPQRWCTALTEFIAHTTTRRRTDR